MIVFLSYFLINIVFNLNIFWRELFIDSSKIGAVWGEIQAYEWLIEKFYQQLISGNNPFGVIKNMLYPFGMHLGLVDAGYGFFFVIFRQFFTVHQSLSIIIALSLLAANLGMYLLLRKIDIDKYTSFIIGAAYGYMTFLMPRGGHLSYWCHFVFPWYYYFIICFLKEKKHFNKVLTVFGSSVFFAFALWLNFYYFVMLLISIASFLFFYWVTDSKKLFQTIRNSLKYIFLKMFFVVILLLPWLIGLYQTYVFDIIPKPNGWSGAIEFSSDLFNYFIPSEYGYLVTKFPFLLKPFSEFLKLYTPSSRAIFENFTYPGVIILVSYLLMPIFFRKIDRNRKYSLKPFLFLSFVFFVLTLGPFLHVFGHWTLTVDEGIKIVIPLPYIILHYIPFLNNIRVPGRLIVAFIFFAYIVSAYFINYFLSRKKNNFKLKFFVFMLIIFFMDHLYNVDPSVVPKNFYPTKLYSEIKKDKSFSTVLEIPFTVRDGFTYFGSIDSFQMIIGESFHGKPVLGGYTGRISDYKKNYYIDNPFLGYLGRIIDSDFSKNPGIHNKSLESWNKINIEKSIDTINLLDIKYVISNDIFPYMATLSSTLSDLGYRFVDKEQNYSLWLRPIDKKEFLQIEPGDQSSSMFLGMGWHEPEVSYRYVDRKSSFLFKVQKSRKLVLNFEAESIYKDIPLTIYVNKEKVGRIDVAKNKKKYSLPINNETLNGLNMVYFIFDKSYRPADIIPGNLDRRQLSAKIYSINISKR